MNFNSNQHEPNTGFDVIPNGNYRVRITQAQEKDNANRNGKYLQLDLELVDAPYRGRKLWARYTTEHETSEQAVEIGLGQISAMARAVNVPSWNHETELIGAIGECKVGVQKDDRERNEVKGWVIPDASKGTPTYNPQRQAQGARQHGVAPQSTQYGASGPRTDVPDFDDDVGF